MKHTITLYIAERDKNAIFQCFENDPEKILCDCHEMTFSTISEVTERRFREIMENSKKDKHRWIAAISYMDNFFKLDEKSIIVA